MTLQGDLTCAARHTAKERLRSSIVSDDISTFRESPGLKILKKEIHETKELESDASLKTVCVPVLGRGSVAVL